MCINPELENRSDENVPTPVLYLTLRHGRLKGFSDRRVEYRALLARVNCQKLQFMRKKPQGQGGIELGALGDSAGLAAGQDGGIFMRPGARPWES